MLWFRSTVIGIGLALVLISSCNSSSPKHNAADSSVHYGVGHNPPDTNMAGQLTENPSIVDSNATAILRQNPNAGDIALSGNVINVKTFGAKGNGKSDDTKFINVALASGKSIYFPAGDYLVNGPLIIRGKKNLRIYGDGNSSWIHPPDQLKVTGKTTFYTTFSIDNCDKISIENMRIESKGENWGDADAGHKQSSGNNRTEWIIQKGGHAVAILRSTNITVKKVTGRFCGSTGVFYASSCDMVTFTDCFANAASLGYAGFAADNFADTRPNFLPGRRYFFNNCKTWAEPKLYPGKKFSSKGAIVAEGDNARVLNIRINGGTFRDCGTGGDVKSLGAAISAENTNLYCKNVMATDNYVGVRIRNRSEVEQEVNATIENSQFTNNGVCGIYVASAHKGPGTINIIGSSFIQRSGSVWGFAKDPPFIESSGIITQGYMSRQKINIKNSTFSGGQKYVFASDRINLAAQKTRFLKSSKGSFDIFGGGTVDIENCDIDMAGKGNIASQNYAKQYASPVSLNFNGNNIQEYKHAGNYWNVSGNTSTKNLIAIQQNVTADPIASSERSAISPDEAVGSIRSYALQGTNTSVIIIMNTPPIFAKAPTQVVNSQNQRFRVLQYIPNWENNPVAVKIFLEKDVRKAFAPNSKVKLKI